MNIANLVVTKGLVANGDTTSPQLIRVTVTTDNIYSGVMDLTWQNVDKDGQAKDIFATANIFVGDASAWLSSWSPLAHLIKGRIGELERLAAEGTANRLSRNMAYKLFANNLVNYADKYRGMQSVVMHQLEGFADVQLSSDKSGEWTVPPHFIDSVAHLAGFIMNCSDSMDTEAKYCVTPGWKSMRFAKPLLPGARHRSYVKMIPSAEDPTVYFGDVYIMQDETIMGMVGGIQFRSYPRILLGRFFTPPDRMAAMEGENAEAAATVPQSTVIPSIRDHGDPKSPAVSKPLVNGAAVPERKHTVIVSAPTEIPAPAQAGNAAAAADSSVAAKALQIIAREAAMEVSDLAPDASFDAMGIDSLMSLVMVEKFRIELDVKVGGSLFLDYPTIGDFCEWLDEYYG